MTRATELCICIAAGFLLVSALGLKLHLSQGDKTLKRLVNEADNMGRRMNNVLGELIHRD